MFDNPMKESEENLVTIDDVEATVFEKFLRFDKEYLYSFVGFWLINN